MKERVGESEEEERQNLRENESLRALLKERDTEKASFDLKGST